MSTRCLLIQVRTEVLIQFRRALGLGGGLSHGDGALASR
jgi:hypothetical protein